MAKFTLKHKTKPCKFIWEDSKLTKWEEVKDFFKWELKHDGLSNFNAYKDIDPKLKKDDNPDESQKSEPTKTDKVSNKTTLRRKRKSKVGKRSRR